MYNPDTLHAYGVSTDVKAASESNQASQSHQTIWVRLTKV